MNAKVIQGAFLGGRPKLPAPVAQPKAMPRPPGPPPPAFAGNHHTVAQAHKAGEAFQVDPARLGLASAGGRPLPNAVRGKMEAALGADFSAVRVHVGPQAERLGALAFTMGTDIYFAPGRFQPDTAHGQQLLGHELAHVVQQRQGRVRNSSGGGVAVVQDRALEAEAERMGHRAASSRVNAAPAVAAPGSRTLAGPALAQRRVAANPPAHPRSHSPVQMAPANKHLKRFLNVVTLGIRIPYVKHKRAVRAAAAAAARSEERRVGKECA